MQVSHTGRQQLVRYSLATCTYVPASFPSLAELPKCRLAIASNEILLSQLLGVMMSPTYKYIAPLVIMAGLLCLAYSPETHPYLSKLEVVEGVIEACEIKRIWCRVTPEERRLDGLLLRSRT